MELLGILPALEGIARSINFQPLDDLIEKIKRFCERLLLQLTPGEPIREGGQSLNGYATRLNDLTTQLNAGMQTLQGTYTGAASANYSATAARAIQRANTLQTHLNTATAYHNTLANHCIEAVFQQGMLVVQGGVMAGDLASLIFTGGLDAPVSVPVAGVDAVVAEGTVEVLDTAVEGADVAMSAIGDSAGDLGELSSSLDSDLSASLEDGGAIDDPGGAGGDSGGGGDGGGAGGNGGGNDDPSPGDRLPDRQPGDKTRGIFSRNGEETDLISGKGGPADSMPSDTPGMRSDMAVRSHVEAQAAALMRQEGLDEATLYINNTPCAGIMGCDAMLPDMLPEGATLTVYINDALSGTSGWVTRIYTGVSDSLWQWPFP